MKLRLIALTIIIGILFMGSSHAAKVYDAASGKFIDASARKTSTSARSINPKYVRKEVNCDFNLKKGTIHIDQNSKYLHLVLGNGRCMRYGIGVGRPGFKWKGNNRVSRKAEWPGWTPPAAMRKRQPELPAYMEGGPNNPLGARAIYIGSTLYRIHGTNQPWTIGSNVSSGCIRLTNDDVEDLYKRVKVGARIVVTGYSAN